MIELGNVCEGIYGTCCTIVWVIVSVHKESVEVGKREFLGQPRHFQEAVACR
jgi:hypothetical protein